TQTVRLGPPPLLHPHTEHWRPTGLCAQPPAVLPLHLRLLPSPQQQLHYQVSRRHHGGRTHSQGDESAYREEVLKLTTWSSENNLTVNTNKTREIIVDFRKHGADPTPLLINGEHVERVQTFKFLGITISDDLSWTANTTAIIKKSQQCLHFLRVLRKNKFNTNLLLTFYQSSIQSLLTYCITVWFGSCTAADKKRLQRVIETVQKIIGCPLPTLTDIYSTRCLSRAQNIIKDSSHPGSDLFNLMPSGRRYRGIRSKTNRVKNSFFPKAITILNSQMHR
uniref:Alkylated DNA repair protein AlkB homologue 8 N-terminal domain-containing protein n=1 Tax=Oryzias sinensis TaxID=183150 RepID=A0A8C7XT65_9TELE